MQGNEDNIDDYTFAMRLQQKFFDDYNDATDEITTSNIKNVESNDYVAMQLQQQMYNERGNGTENDYIVAMQLQEKYNKEETNVRKEYEDLASYMNNISLKNSEETPRRFLNKLEKEIGDKEPYNRNFFQNNYNDFDDNDSPPPYYSFQKPAPVSTTVPTTVPQQFPQQFPQYQQQQTTSNYQDMFSQFMKFMEIKKIIANRCKNIKFYQ
ncbi:19398_t:CDS:2 [Gigaspora rosea]|nr:19398_t:CDS:2 [Gigaspora rosea]